MSIEFLYEKIPFLQEFPDFIVDGSPCVKRLGSFTDDIVIYFLNNVLNLMGDYYGGMHFFINSSPSSQNFNREMSTTLMIWKSGLADITVAQIVNTIIALITCKTEYIKSPPRSVIEFHALCQEPKPVYYNMYFEKPVHNMLLTYDKESAQKHSESVAEKYLKEIKTCIKNSRFKGERPKP